MFGKLVQQQPAPTQFSAQLTVGSPAVMVTPYRMGMDTQTCWVMVTVQLVPSAFAVQVIRGVPWQLTAIVPTTVVGVSVKGAVTSTHWVPTLPQPPGWQLSSAVQDSSGSCS